MRGLNRQQIRSHDQLTGEVSVTEYQDGTRVYVNYGDSDYSGEGITVPARDYLVERRDGR